MLIILLKLLLINYLSLGKSRSASVGGTTIVQDNDDLGEIEFCGADGVDLITRAATIRAKVDGTPGADDLPGSLIFSTTADGANAPTDRLLINSSGNVGIGTLTPSHRLHVLGPSGTNFAIEANASGCNFNLSDNDTTTSFRTVDGRLHIDADAGGAVDNSEIRFLVDSSQKFVIKNTGNVGIGTSDPSDKLHVAGDMIVADPSGTSTIDIRGAEGANANLNLTAGSGTPYSQQTNATTSQFGIPIQTTLEGSVNGSRKPWSFRADLKLNKEFSFSLGEVGGNEGVKLEQQYLVGQNGLELIYHHPLEQF